MLFLLVQNIFGLKWAVFAVNKKFSPDFMKDIINIHKGIIKVAQQNKYRRQEKSQFQKKQIAGEKIQNLIPPLLIAGSR